MSTSTTETFETWKHDETPFSILYTRELLREINFSVVEGFRKIPHGGVESGGVLFGTRDADAIRLIAQRPIACQHQSGPSFILSANDIEGLRKQLESYRSDEALSGLEPLGWFIAHNRSDLQMNDREAELFGEFFPHAWQVTILARPDKVNPTRFGFVFRRADGSLDRDAGKNAFDHTGPAMVLPQFPFETVRRERGRREVPPPADSPSSELASAIPESLASEEKGETEKQEPTPEPVRPSQPPQEKKLVVARALQTASAPPEPAVPIPKPDQAPAASTLTKEETPVLPELTASTSEERRVPSSLWTSVASFILGILIAGGPAWWWSTQRLPSRIELNAWDNNGKLTIFWPSVEIRAALNGYLVIRENGRQRRVDLSKGQLDSGRFTFDRQTDDVAIELHAEESNHESVGMVRFVNGRSPEQAPDVPDGAQVSPQTERRNQPVSWHAKPKKKKRFFFF